ncbi:MAG: hypothetical protein ACR2PG_07640 [Hyphomicrobiaceae bacterium]
MTDSSSMHRNEETGPLSRTGVKILQFAVIFMGVLIVVGLGVVIGRIMYLAAQPERSPLDMAKLAETGGFERYLALPPATTAKSVSIDAGQMLVHYEGDSSAGAIVIDLRSGHKIGHYYFTRRLDESIRPVEGAHTR